MLAPDAIDEVVRFENGVLVTFGDGVIAMYSALLLREMLDKAEVMPEGLGEDEE